MTCRHIGAALLGMVLLSSPTLADVLLQDDYVQFTSTLTDNITIPAYERFAVETAILSDTLTNACAHPTTDAMQAVTDRFHDTMDAWARVQPILFGPVMNAPGPARFQFWPDKRGTGQRQLRRILGDSDPSVLDAKTLDAKSIALGDLQALEYILFDDPDALTKPGSFRCAYAKAIAELQRSRAALLYQAWSAPDGFRAQVINAAGGTDAFYDEREAASAYLNSIIGALEAIRLQKLERPLGLTLEGARSTRSESWRSGRSLRNIQLNFETIAALFNTPHGLKDLALQAHSEESATRVESLMFEIKDRLKQFTQPLAELVADKTARPELETLLTQFRNLQTVIEQHIARDVGLVAGFNATDGD